MAKITERTDLSKWQLKEKKSFQFEKTFESKNIWLFGVLIIVLAVLWLTFNSIRKFASDENTIIFFSNYWLIIFGALAMTLTFFAIWLIPKWQIRTLKDKKGSVNQSDFDLEKERIKLRDDTRKTMAQIVGGILFAIGLIGTFSTLELNRRTQQSTLDAQSADRYSKAIDSLGAEGLPARLGGLYTLDRIAKESPQNHQPIMEILTIYIREKSNVQKELLNQNKSDDSLQKPANTNTQPQENEESNLLPAPPDVLAAAAIISRRNNKNDKIDFVFNLSNSNLNEADLGKAELQDADLSHTKLYQANLRDSYLNRANLSYTNLQAGYLNRAELIGANLHKANLSKAFLRETKLWEANLTEALLIGANLEGANLTKAKLGGADLFEADLDFAILVGADLAGAKFGKAELFKTDLTNADLRGADLSTSLRLVFAQISVAIIDSSTKLPTEFEARRIELMALSKEKLEERRKNK